MRGPNAETEGRIRNFQEYENRAHSAPRGEKNFGERKNLRYARRDLLRAAPRRRPIAFALAISVLRYGYTRKAAAFSRLAVRSSFFIFYIFLLPIWPRFM